MQIYAKIVSHFRFRKFSNKISRYTYHTFFKQSHLCYKITKRQHNKYVAAFADKPEYLVTNH